MADRNQMKMTSKNERDSKAHSYRAKVINVSVELKLKS